MQVAPTRRLRLIVPHGDGTRLLADGVDLPAVDVELADGEATVAGAGRWLRGAGLAPWPVDCVIDQIDADDLGDRVREAMVVVDPPPAGWAVPARWRWIGWADVAPSVADGIAAVVDERVSELVGVRPVPENRADWARSGWIDAVRKWVERVLADNCWAPILSITPVRLWGISAVVRIDTMNKRCYFKAVAPLFAAEPAITAELERRSGGATPSVIAVDHERGWMLTDDLGHTEVSTEADTRRAIDLLVSLQRRLVDHRAELERAGCRHRPLGVLADAVAAAVGAPVTKAVVAVDAATRARIVDGVAEAVATVETWRLSETVAHGDFHPGNVAATDRSVVIFDWSDACFTSPLVDAVTWVWWYTDDPVRTEFVWSCFESAWRRELGLDAAAFDRRAAQVVAAAFHLTSYVEICEAIEPASRADHVEGLTHFVGILERTCQ